MMRFAARRLQGRVAWHATSTGHTTGTGGTVENPRLSVLLYGLSKNRETRLSGQQFL